MKHDILIVRNWMWRRCCLIRKWRQAGLFRGVNGGPSNNVLQATPTALRNFGIRARSSSCGWFVTVRASGQARLGPPENGR